MATPVRVFPVSGRRDSHRFIAFPYSLYRDSRYWVAPLRRDQARVFDERKNPFFAHSRIERFLAFGGAGRVVGRIAAITNGMHLAKYEDRLGFFGFFECVEEYEVARGLLDAASAWLRAQGMASIRGPVNPSLNETSGLLVGGFDRTPAILMPYNPPYYEDFLRRYGFERRMTLWAYYGAWKHLNRGRLNRGVAMVERRSPGLRVRKPDMRRYLEEARTMCRLYNEAFASGWGQVPLTEAEFLAMAKAMRPILDPDLVFFLEHQGAPVGFSLSVPDVNSLLRHLPEGRLAPFGFLKLLAYSRLARPREFRMLLLALLPAYQRRGLDALLIARAIEEGRRKGYLAAELSWVMDDNRVLKNALEKLGAVRDKEYALFEKKLDSPAA